MGLNSLAPGATERGREATLETAAGRCEARCAEGVGKRIDRGENFGFIHRRGKRNFVVVRDLPPSTTTPRRCDETVDTRGVPVLAFAFVALEMKRCPHGKRKDNCAECDGCVHGKVKKNCAECNPCPHGKVKNSC